jgi:hypothetical protein
MEMSSYRQTDGFGDEGSYKSVGTHDDHVSALQIGCALLRLRSAVDPREQDGATEVSDGWDDDPRESIPWDWKESTRVRVAGNDWETMGFDDLEESLWFAEA